MLGLVDLFEHTGVVGRSAIAGHPAVVGTTGVVGPTAMPGHPAAPDPRLVLVTVAGPTARKVLQVPLDVPMRHLAAGMGAEVGAPFVTAVTVHGERIAPGRTLGEVGVRPGSVIVLDGPDAPLPET